MALKDYKESPVFVSLSMIAIVGTSITAFGVITGSYDRAHVNEQELSESHPVSASEIQAIADKGFCQTLDLKISIIEDQIFQMEQAGQNSSRMVEKKRLLSNLEEQYRKMNCVGILGQV